MMGGTRAMTRRSKTTASNHSKLAVLVEIARHGSKEPLTTSKMVTATGISVSYVEVACAWLRHRGLVKSFRGGGGGYMLTRPAPDIFVADIVDSIKGGFGKQYLGADAAASATILELWDQSESMLMQIYRHISLADIVRGDLQAHPMLKRFRDSCQQVNEQNPSGS
jgi:Rrf2 family transcriptional regulator, iron-sulfur cluster assembly transcription factor